MSKLLHIAIVLFALWLVPSESPAQQFESDLLPGLAELFKENAPSKLDRWIENQVKTIDVPTDIKGLLKNHAKLLVGALGLGPYQALRQCMSDGIVHGYSVGVAAGVWETEVDYVRNELLLAVPRNLSTLPARCSNVNVRFLNASLVRGYVEALNLPTKRRRTHRDLLSTHIEKDKSWLPGFTAKNDPAFLFTYANAFTRYYVKKK